MRSISSAYTLVELLVALALSLLLLLAVTELLGRVGGAMNDTRSAMSTSTHLHEVAMLLRQDLSLIPQSLATKPIKIADPGAETSDQEGYLEITEGPDTTDHHPFVNERGDRDDTVGDVDDMIGFTVLATRMRGLNPVDMSFRGVLYNGEELRIAERESAEVNWFVRGNTLYRRIRLIDDQRADVEDVNTLIKLARRERRFGHDTLAANSFPYPRYLFDSITNKPTDWYFLRMPTLEETLHGDWEPGNIPKTFVTEVSNPNLWEQPYFFPSLQDKWSGSLKQFVHLYDDPPTPRHVRAGEDVVLTNVLSFDIKLWCPHEKEFFDLGDSRSTTWNDGENPGWTNKDDPSDTRRLPRTWDSWTRKYSDDYPEYANDKGIVMPPYAKPLEAIQITIRCFDPASRAVKQVTVVHRFDP